MGALQNENLVFFLAWPLKWFMKSMILSPKWVSYADSKMKIRFIDSSHELECDSVLNWYVGVLFLVQRWINLLSLHFTFVCASSSVENIKT